jgi:hypothetical protein
MPIASQTLYVQGAGPCIRRGQPKEASRWPTEEALGRFCSQVTLYAPYWLDNRTGMDLAFQDAPPSGRILGVRSRFDYNEVVAQGVRVLGVLDTILTHNTQKKGAHASASACGGLLCVKCGLAIANCASQNKFRSQKPTLPEFLNTGQIHRALYPAAVCPAASHHVGP